LKKKIYLKEKIKRVYFGHPLIDNINVTLNKYAFCKKYNIPSDKKIVAVFPGSRKQEIHHHMPVIMKTILQMEAAYNDLYFVVNCAETINIELIQQYANQYALQNICIIQNENYNLLNASYTAICVSGTITLETAFFLVPFVVIYRIDMFFYLLIKYLLSKVKHICLVNLIAEKTIIQELLQNRLTVKNLVKELENLIKNSIYRKKIIHSLKNIKKILGKKGISKKIASAINSLL